MSEGGAKQAFTLFDDKPDFKTCPKSHISGSADAAAECTSYLLRFGVQDVGSFFRDGFRVWAVVHALWLVCAG